MFWRICYVDRSLPVDLLNQSAMLSSLEPLTLYVDSVGTPPRDIPLLFANLYRLFMRCKSLVLDSDLYQNMSEITNALAVHNLPLLDALFVTNSAPFPTLRGLPISTFRTTLTSLYTSGCTVHFDPALRFFSLTTLVIANVSIRDIYGVNEFAAICVCAPGLVRLFFDNVDCDRLTSTVWASRFQPLVHLRTLRVAFADGVMCKILSCMDLPNLHTLFVEADPYQLNLLITERTPFLSKVRTLELHLRSSRCTLVGLFQLLPRLERLDILHRHTPILEALLGEPGSDSWPSPHLETMSVKCNPDLVQKVLEKRVEGDVALVWLLYSKKEDRWTSYREELTWFLQHVALDMWDGYTCEPWVSRFY
ncbi:hypothetical protein C8R46DRAFT_1235779 [Mycena filopes]|nr:hypothetical protein C8R46DRAFT_1235779 [Mycena filopes]